MFYYQQTKDVFRSFDIEIDGEILRCIGNKLRAEFLMYLYRTPMEVRTKKEMLFTIIQNVSLDKLLETMVQSIDTIWFDGLMTKMRILEGVQVRFGEVKGGVAGKTTVVHDNVYIVLNLKCFRHWFQAYQDSKARSFGHCQTFHCMVFNTLAHELVHMLCVRLSPEVDGQRLADIGGAHSNIFMGVLANCFKDYSQYHSHNILNN